MGARAPQVQPKKTKQDEQIEALQSELKTLRDQFGKFSQPKQTAMTTPSTGYALTSTLGGQRNLRIASGEPKASSIRRRNRAM